MKIGLDVGSTTLKCVVLSDSGEILHSSYERHYSQIPSKTAEVLRVILPLVGTEVPQLAISGSAGMGMAQSCNIPFVQEVYATRLAANAYIPGTDVIIELGGEDAKILFLDGGLEVRMNGSCAGGTGAFIDQMATLLGVTQDDMDRLAAQSHQIYTIASRCGVFAKSDIQPLINQGAKREDIAASIFSAVVNQTIAGLAQGRPIKGSVAYLGGPLTFMAQLRRQFDETLHVTGLCPENSLYYVALGAANYAHGEGVELSQLIARLENYHKQASFLSIDPLFSGETEYMKFVHRHEQATVPMKSAKEYSGPVFLGIDAGSTTVKAICISFDGEILYQRYQSNTGNPVPIVREYLQTFMAENPRLAVSAAAVTGYGEDIVKNAFCIDYGVVETVAHFTAAKRFMPEVDFIIDIGGQDIKCFKIHNGTIDNIFLNEACSSGCGSFLQTFANTLGYSIEDFAKLGLKGKHPVDLGSRCTVFMNSSVKQAQKDGATIEDISAGLSISVVKNALYKVIRATSAEELGRHVVVQGGTFLNDAVLRAFEKELDAEVVRPTVAGLMGAYGAALYAKEQYLKRQDGKTSTLLSLERISSLRHDVRSVRCNGCSNHCQLTINIFDEGRRFISGNRCERPVTKSATVEDVTLRNIYAWKQRRLCSYVPTQNAVRGDIGIPLCLNMFELLPFWHTFFTALGFSVRLSPFSNRTLYLDGQATIPSDTVCFPAKLAHGHVQYLADQGVKRIFYPCMSYNVDERKGDNHFNCPVVAYYPEVISANMGDLKERGIDFICDYVGLNRKGTFVKRMFEILNPRFSDISKAEIHHAANRAYEELQRYMDDLRHFGDGIITRAREENRPIIVLSGRPYHVDPEVNHGIDQLILSFGASIVSEDVVSVQAIKDNRTVLNQWTYHARLYDAAKQIRMEDDMQLVQLVSFGCGLDAVTTDEVREILENAGKIYTQIKIDEITNLGAVKIRLRSLFAAVGL